MSYTRVFKVTMPHNPDDPDQKATDVNSGIVTGNMVQCRTVDGGIRFGGQ